MFLIAMHLMYKRKKNPLTPIPTEMPIELRIPAYEGEQPAFGAQNFQSMSSSF
jgi:hypothetical protein